MLKITLVGITNLHAPTLTIGKILFDFSIQMRHIDHDFFNAMTRQMLYQVFHDRFT